MTTIPTPVRRQRPVHTDLSTNQQKDTVMGLTHGLQLINEALSRARMLRPQTPKSEATRPARQIMMSSRLREQDRLLGL
jgi:hypothetical protein